MSLRLHRSPKIPPFLANLRRLAAALAFGLLAAAGLTALLGYLQVTLTLLVSLPLGAAIFNTFSSPEPEDSQGPNAP